MMIEFARAELEKEFYFNLVANARELALRFAQFSKDNGLPTPVLTALSREPGFYEKNGLTRKLFSWHYRIHDPAFKNEDGTTRWFTCGMDWRNIGGATPLYRADQLQTVNEWWKDHCKPSAQWELITKTHGTGPHIHVAFRDYRLRRLWDAANNAKNKEKS